MTRSQLTIAQRDQLVAQGCTATDWSKITISPGCDCSNIAGVHFAGTVQIGETSGSQRVDGVELPNGIYDASVADCEIGDRVRIARVGSVIAHYCVGNDVLIQDVGALVAESDSTFGNGVELETINEGGGRGVRIINGLTSQTAYMQGMMRNNKSFCEKLQALVEAEVSEARSGKGVIADRARIVHCGTIRNVVVGKRAFIHGAQFLENGTILSCDEHPTEIGEGVQAKAFIISEGARVDGGAILDKVFVGQAVKMGKQYSAENSLFFANCEAFHGEAVSLFGGPYTVTHHKSTLLIAGIFSFYNAGSGSNQSNHMYKLGPVHQGVLERGCKTGSFSYLLLEAHIGAFSVVIGKHYANLDVANLPFSYISEEDGGSKIVPAVNLVTVGTVRDGEKWPKRDGRKASAKKDLITFDVFSPYTVERMRKGRDELLSLSERVPKEKVAVNYGGAQLSRLLLKKGAKYYGLAITRYVLDKVLGRVQEALAKYPTWSAAIVSLKPASQLHTPSAWTDLSGLIAPQELVEMIEERVTAGVISSYDQLVAELRSIHERYHEDEWQYVAGLYEKEFGSAVHEITKERIIEALEQWEAAASALHGMILEDSKKEFGSFARIGYGLDMTEEDQSRDFEAVRGTVETNSVVQKLVSEAAALKLRKEEFKALVEGAK